MKSGADGLSTKLAVVVPLVGTWIEIMTPFSTSIPAESFPLWERGLKYSYFRQAQKSYAVVPLVGTWIEIETNTYLQRMHDVVPLVGTWIEIWVLWQPC